MRDTDGVAIVTGGTRGIGRAITKLLTQEGYKVAAIYHSNDEAAKKCAKESGAKTYKLDITDHDACAETCKQIEAKLGPVKILVNNAGITRDSVLHKMSLKDWQDVIETNLTSCFNLCHAVLPYMRGRRYGRIINISSINGQKGQFGQANYSAAKAGVIGFTKALALESATKGITVNAVCPGYTETGMTASMKSETLDSIIKQIPVHRMGKTEEIAEVVAFLASEKASFITGSTIGANGGQYMS